jgi:hypothetical protein
VILKKWEYLQAYVSDERVSDVILILNEYGADGWEFTGQTEDTGFGALYLMKRERE